VFRVAVLSIVFAFAAAPEATLLCRLWCPNELSASVCRHHGQSSSIGIRAADGCEASDPNVASLTREDSRRVPPGSATWSAVPVQRYQLATSTLTTRTVESWARLNAFEKRPLETTLRL
jgi:hypothetical protein